MAASKKKAAKKATKADAPPKPKPKKKARKKRRSWTPRERSPLHLELGLAFMRLREAAGISLREMAKKLGVSVNSVRWHEAGATLFRAHLLFKSAKVLGCTGSDLLNAVDHEDSDPVNADA